MAEARGNTATYVFERLIVKYYQTRQLSDFCCAAVSLEKYVHEANKNKAKNNTIACRSKAKTTFKKVNQSNET